MSPKKEEEMLDSVLYIAVTFNYYDSSLDDCVIFSRFDAFTSRRYMRARSDLKFAWEVPLKRRTTLIKRFARLRKAKCRRQIMQFAAAAELFMRTA